MSFKNKVVLITGASAGIGATTAETFAKEGASLALVGRNEAKLKEVADRCNKYGAKSLTIKADVSRDQEADSIVKKAVDKFGQLDVLVNNVGILKEASILAENFLENYDEVVNINTRGTIRITYFAVPHIIKTKGNIVNVSSIAALRTLSPNYISYRTSKAALTHFTRCLALEMAPYGVRVNTVSPGPVKTNMLTSVNEEHMKKRSGLNRIATPQEIADMILYLADEKAKGITGADFLVDNGTSLK